MLFQSVEFLVFMAVLLPLFWAMARRRGRRQALLLVGSYLFYGMYEAWFLALIVFSTLLDYQCGERIQAAHDVGSRSSAKRWLWLSLVGNLGVLGFFKYTDWFFDNMQWVATALGSGVDLVGFKRSLLPDFIQAGYANTLTPEIVRDIVLPVGISFYTFQTLSYTIDIYRGKLKPARTFGDFALFVSFFPQLVAGPIVRAAEFLPQLDLLPRIDRKRLHEALWRIGCGLTRKIVFADLIGLYLVDPVFNDPLAYSAEVHVLAIIGFGFQIYNDFAGYSEMAIGVAKLFGFDLPENFAYPFRSISVREFWTRWHMTLSFWLRDYVFQPLGGWRSKMPRAAFNNIATMVLIGLWHGASWLWVWYGLVNAIAMIVEVQWRQWRKKRARAAGVKFELAQPGTLKWWIKAAFAYPYFIVIVFGSSASIRAGTWETMGNMFLRAGDKGIESLSVWALVVFIGTWALILLPRSWVDFTHRLVHRAPTWLVAAWLGTMVAVTALLLIGQQPFIYFQF
jgi:alginate O-acetyltransferase complex protein AlgI